MQHASVCLKRSNHSQWNLSYGNKKKNKVCSLPSVSAFFEEGNIEPHKTITMMISVKEHLPVLADGISLYFPNLLYTPPPQLHLPETHSQPDEDVPETGQEFMEQPCGDARYKIWKQVFAVLCCIFIHFQTCIFVKQGFPADWLSSLNTEVDLWKVSFIVLSIKAAPRIPDLLRKKHSHTD